MTTRELVLASASPRRLDLLARLSVFPRVEPADIDEAALDGEEAAAYVERLARAKAATATGPGRVVLAADTAVVLNGAILGKPTDIDDARSMLGSLAARSHDVVTGVAVCVTEPDGSTRTESAVARSAVEIGDLSTDRVEWYAASGEPDDKAGGYGLQGAAALFADRVRGSVTNVIGLPLPLVDELFGRHGLDLLDFRSAAAVDPVRAIAERALAHVLQPPGSDDPVVRWASPSELAAEFASTVGIDFADTEPAHEPATLVAAAEQVISRSVHTNHPRFVNQNYAGADPLAVVGDWLGAALNTAHTTYEIAPVFMAIERALLDKLARLIGFDPSGDHPAGLVCAGGSLAGLHAMQLARHARRPSVVMDGDDPTRWRILVSESAHYSAEKIAAVMGLGRRAVESVATDPSGAMAIDALDAALDADGDVLAVIATAGTTVTGAFDPIDAIADRCADRGVWLHVDGAFGAAALFSPTQRWRCSGVERADSVVWNLHKMAGMTQQCSTLLVREPDRIPATFSAGADYLFQPDKQFGDHDTGDFTLMCGRRVDVLKAWLTWKGRGDAGMAARVDHSVGIADHVRRRAARRDDIATVVAGDFVNVCLTWVPPDLRPFDLNALGDDERAMLHAVAPAAKARMQADGSALIGFQPVHGLNCFRLLFMNPAVTTADADRLLDLIAEHSEAAWRLAHRATP